MEKVKVVYRTALAYAWTCVKFLMIVCFLFWRAFSSALGMECKGKIAKLGNFSLREAFRTQLRSNNLNVNKKVALHQPAPNAELWNLASETKCRLLDFAKPNRLLVLNFGSCT